MSATSEGRTFPALSLAEAHRRLTAPGSPFEIEERVIRGVVQKVWKNAPPTLREAFQLGRAHGAKTFIVYEQERVTFDGLARAALAFAEALRRAGIVKGDRVAIAMRNLPEWPAVFFGAVLAGAIATPLNAWGTGAELEYGLVDSGAKAAVVDRERLERLHERLHNCPDLERIFVGRESEEIGHPRVARLEAVLGDVGAWARLPERPLPDVALAPEDDATIFYTSGTTGRPKGALGTHRNSCTTIMAYPFSRARAGLRGGGPVPQPSPDGPQKAALVAIPFFHATGCQALMIPSFVAGAKLVLMPKWDVALAFDLIARERVTQTGGVPTVAWQLLEHPAVKGADLSSLETISYGGAPAAAELVRLIGRATPRAAPGIGWGMTETSATFTHHQGDDYVARPDSCGPPLPICAVRVVAPDGRDLPVGEAGELWAKGPNVVREYWRNPQATAQTFVDGWLRTGDIARLDAEGFCTIVDRAKDMLIRGGENIYCIEVENALYEHPQVIDAAVVGVPHHTLGEEPAAVVTIKAGGEVREAELRAFVAERLAAFKVPVRVVTCTQMLPRNATGKILKRELKALFA